jgi:hypothetical protein
LRKGKARISEAEEGVKKIGSHTELLFYLQHKN